MHLFRKDADFEAFQRVIIEAHQRHPIRILYQQERFRRRVLVRTLDRQV